jgi:hypothetical protein
MSSRRARTQVGTLGGLALLAACGPAAPAGPADGDGRARPAMLTQEIRPTDGTGWMGNGYEEGVVVSAYDPPGGHFRVHYTLSGMSAVDPTDRDPMDGVPDFVNQVGLAAEATYQSTVVARGFRPPLDDSVYHDRPDFGGDGRFDIYLRQCGAGSDGYRVVEVCTDGSDGGAPDRCAGYFVMTPNFAGRTYKTDLDGIQVLTSHELFHAIQDAYGTGQWRTFSEGTAVWNELQVFPRTPEHDGTWRDYLAFAPALFTQPERPLDKSMGTGPATDYAYGAAVWFEFLSERFGPQLIRELWEGSQAAGQPTQFLDVTESVLGSRYQTTLAAAFGEFVRWNLLTGRRAPAPAAVNEAPRGYRSAEEYPEARLEQPLTHLGERRMVTVDGLSARYFEFVVPLDAPPRLRLHVEDASPTPVVATLYAVPVGGATPGPAMQLPGATIDVDVQPGQHLLLAVAGTSRGAAARPVTVYVDDNLDLAGGAGCAVTPAGVPAGAPAGAGEAGGLGALLALFGLAARNRRRVRR